MNYEHYMLGVRERLERLVSTLTARGYLFQHPLETMGMPGAEADRQLGHLEKRVGIIPAALAAFWRNVGSVDLTGRHPEWTGCDYPDSLLVYSVDAALSEANEYLELDDPATEYWASASGVFRAPIAPDKLHKENVSGGMWYGVEIPNASDDPIVLEEGHDLPFTEYLEFALRWGGFPGLEHVADHTWPLNELRIAAGRRTRG